MTGNKAILLFNMSPRVNGMLACDSLVNGNDKDIFCMSTSDDSVVAGHKVQHQNPANRPDRSLFHLCPALTGYLFYNIYLKAIIPCLIFVLISDRFPRCFYAKILFPFLVSPVSFKSSSILSPITE